MVRVCQSVSVTNEATDLVSTLGGTVTKQNASGPAWQEWLVTTWLGEGAFVEVNTLDLRKTKVTDDHLATVSALRYLREILLDRCSITDAGLKRLSGLNQLESVSVRYTQVSNAGLTTFSAMPSLECLRLTGTNIDDTGLLSISHLTSLTEVYARWTHVTPEGAAEIRNAIPKCVVHVQPVAK